jgi:crossover junction endodeoxyribonuclease RusA
MSVIDDIAQAHAQLDRALRTATRHVVVLPTGLRLMNSNERLHPRVRALRTAALRQAAREAAMLADLPHLDRAHIYCHLRGHNKGRRDPGNWYPSAKAAVDGLVDAGVLDDDDHTRVVGPDMRLAPEIVHGGQLVLTLIELPS